MRIQKIVLSLVILLGLYSGSAVILATTDDVIETTDVSVSKTLDVVSDQNQDNMDIVFSIPVVARVNPIDLVLVLDQSFSDTEMRNSLSALFDEIVSLGTAKVNIAVVTFQLNVTDKFNGLIELNESTLASVKNAINTGSSAGSNLQGALLKAKRILDASATADQDKYLIVASDFAGNKLDSGNGLGRVLFVETANRYLGYGDPLLFGAQLPNNTDFDTKYSKTNTAFFNSLTTASIDQLINQETLFSGTTVTSADPNYKYLTEIGDSVSEYTPDFIRFTGDKVLSDVQKSTITTLDNLKTATFTTQLEKNIYHSGNLLQEMKAPGYNISAYTRPYEPSGFSPGNRFEIIANLFQEWFEENIGTRFDKAQSETITDLVADLKNEILYQIGQGEIIDVVNDQFQVVKGDYEVTVNGTALAKSELSADRFGFGIADAFGIYPYELEYSLTAQGKEQIRWMINTEANNFDLLNLKFGIAWKTIPTAIGTHLYDTNDSAVLNYMDSSEKGNGETEYTKTQSMPSPQLSKSIGGVIAAYEDEQGNPLASSVTTTGEQGFAYQTQPMEISGYTLSTVEGSPAGVYTDSLISIRYIYAQNKKIVTERFVFVNYVDEQGNILAEQIVLKGQANASYTTEQKTIEGYRFVSVEGNTSGVFGETEQVVTYVYTKITEDAPIVSPDKDELLLPDTGITTASSLLASAFILIGALITVSVICIRRKTD